jgi:hypothetical protein
MKLKSRVMFSLFTLNMKIALHTGMMQTLHPAMGLNPETPSYTADTGYKLSKDRSMFSVIHLHYKYGII